MHSRQSLLQSCSAAEMMPDGHGWEVLIPTSTAPPQVRHNNPSLGWQPQGQHSWRALDSHFTYPLSSTPESSLEGRSHFSLVRQLFFPLRTSPSWFWLTQTPWKTPRTLGGVGTSTQMSRHGLNSLLSGDLAFFIDWNTTPNICTLSLQKEKKLVFHQEDLQTITGEIILCYCKVFGDKSRMSPLHFHHAEF